MTRDLPAFELYLMSRMRGRTAVDEALRALGVDEAAMRDAAARVRERGVERPGHAVNLYVELIGEPLEVSAEPSSGPPTAFSGSRRYRFRLPAWGRHDFIVRAHPAGWAWGPEFVSRPGERVDLPRDAADLRPWSAIESEVIAAYGAPVSEDAWEASKDVVLRTRGGRRGVEAIALCFDFSLLQCANASSGRGERSQERRAAPR